MPGCCPKRTASSTADRARSDEMTAKAAEVEAKLMALQDGTA